MSTSSSTDCPSHFLLDQWVLGELETAARVDVEQHVASCARCQRRLEERRTAEAAFVVDVSTLRALQAPSAASGGGSVAPARVAASAPPSRFVRWSQRGRGLALGGAVAAALAVVVVQGGRDVVVADDASAVATTLSPVSTTGVQAKGRAHSALYVKDAAGVRPLSVEASATTDAAPARVHPGDTVQVAVTSSSPVFVAVVSQDGAGHISTYVGDDDGGLVRVAAGRNVPLPGATILDDVAGQETVAVFLCDAPGVRVEALAASVTSGAPPAGCVVERHVLDKKEFH